MIESMRGTLYRLLRLSERYVKTDMVYLTKGGSWLLLSQAAATLLGLILSIGFGHLLPKEVFGNYRFVLSAAAIVSAFGLTGMGTAIVRATAQKRGDALRGGARFALRWNLVELFIALGAALYYYANGNDVLAVSFLIVALLSPLFDGLVLFGSYLNGRHAYRELSAMNMFRTSVNTAALLITAYLYPHAPAIIGSYFVSSVITAGLCYAFTIRRFSVERGIDAQALSDSKHYTATNLLGLVAGQIDKILVFHYLGAAELAIYAFAVSPLTQLESVNKIIGTLAFPKLSAGPVEEIRPALVRKSVTYLLFMSLIVLAYILAAPYIFRLLFPAYLESVAYSQVYALALLLPPLTLFFFQSILAHGTRKMLYGSQTVPHIIRIGLFFLLIPPYGIWGAVGAVIGYRVVNSAFNYWLHRHL